MKNTHGVEITIQEVEKSFGDHTVLKNLSIHIEAGEFVVIVGKSGSGKSTLLRLTAGLEEPTSGKITFNDTPIKALEIENNDDVPRFTASTMEIGHKERRIGVQGKLA